MSIFSKGFDEDDYLNNDDGSMFGGAERREERERKLARAKEIASGLVLGTFERDEDVWALARKIKGEPLMAKDKLPNKPSKLLALALADFEWVEKNPKYVINMGDWHTPGYAEIRHFNGKTEEKQEVCQVCFAGSVMAKSLKTDWDDSNNPDAFDSETRGKLMALNEFREGYMISSLDHLGVHVDKRKDIPAYWKDSKGRELNMEMLSKYDRPTWKKEIKRMIKFLASKGL